MAQDPKAVVGSPLTTPMVVERTTQPAPVDPTIIDDADDGYVIGSRWVNTLTGDTFTLTDPTPGAAVWVNERGGGGDGAASPLSGDLGGTTTDGYVKTVRGVSGTFSYDGQNRLVFMSTALGTKTFDYNPDGTLGSITGTGNYRSKQFTYSGGLLVDVVVS